MNPLMKIYTRIFPASKRHAAEIEGKLDEIRRNQQRIEKQHAVELKKLQEELDSLKKEQQDSVRRLAGMQEEILGYVRENNWGLVFQNTVLPSSWLKNKAFSFGRWAVGYPCAYVLFRVLNEIKPDSILELGLGQSTKMIGQYADSRDGVAHLVMESDHEWIDFFQNNYEAGANSRIICCSLALSGYEQERGIYAFDGFEEKTAGRKFNLIVIDAPWDGGVKDYARIDILRILPDCLEESFVILMDDVGRDAEKNTFDEMKLKLDKAGIAFESGIYTGKMSVGVIVSKDLKFVLTM